MLKKPVFLAHVKHRTYNMNVSRDMRSTTSWIDSHVHTIHDHIEVRHGRIVERVDIVEKVVRHASKVSRVSNTT